MYSHLYYTVEKISNFSYNSVVNSLCIHIALIISAFMLATVIYYKEHLIPEKVSFLSQTGNGSKQAYRAVMDSL